MTPGPKCSIVGNKLIISSFIYKNNLPNGNMSVTLKSVENPNVV